MPSATDAWMVTVARRLGDLRDEVVFVGGAVLGLLIDDVGATTIRPTDDLDVIVDVSSRVGYHALEARLRGLGFRSDTSAGAPLCRWLVDDVVVDVMPTTADILGVTNRWYGEATSPAIRRDIAPGLTVRVASAPCFVAMKLEAFAGRGGDDLVASLVGPRGPDCPRTRSL